MSGLVAVVSVSGRRHVEPADLQALVASYQAARGQDQVVRACASDPRAAAAVLGSDCQTAWAAHEPRPGGSWALTAGTVRAVGGPPLPASWPLPDVGDLDGQFSLISHDRARDEVLVVNDPFGMMALYVAEREGLAFVSTCSLALARHLHALPDTLRLQEFLLTGYHFGSGTHWRGIHRLDPATAMTFDRTGQHRRTYWRPQVDERTRAMSLDETVDHTIDVTVDALRAAVGDQPDTWLDLTGGFDSRLLALLLHRAGIGFRANTRGTTHPEDIQIAGTLAQVMGWRWESRHLPPDWDQVLPDVLPRALAWGDASLGVLQLARILYAHELLAAELPSLVSAGGGEHFQWAPWKTEFVGGRSTSVNYDNWIDMRLMKPMDRSVLRGNPLPAVREDFRGRMSRWAEPYSEEINTTQLDVLYAYKSAGHFGAYRSADDGVLRAQLPYYFRPVFEAAFSTDFRFRNNHRLMRHMIERLDPRAAALPTTRGGPAQPWRPSNVHRFAPYYRTLTRKSITKVSGRVGHPLLVRSSSFSWAQQANAVVLDALRRDGVITRADELRSAPLYEPAELDRLLAEAREPGFRQHALLGRVVTVELALRSLDACVD